MQYERFTLMYETTNNIWKRTWAEIDINNLKYNYQTIKKMLPSNTKTCCVVKANAYGHGAQEIAKALQTEGADWFAVSNISEALEIRECGIKRPILILGYTPCDCAELLSKNNISQCVYSLEYAKKLSNHAQRANCTVNIHIKIDTGMGRIGFDGFNESSTDAIFEACKLKNLTPEGIFTHFAKADCGEVGRGFTVNQFSQFESIINKLHSKGVSFKLKHCSNSAAIVDFPEFSLDMVRPGIILYGLQPSPLIKNKIKLLPVMQLKTVISYIKEVAPNTPISYGSEYITKNKQRIATIPIGYADGLWCSNFRNKTKVLVNNTLVPVVGRICMDQTMIDVSTQNKVREGDEVIIFGDKDGIISADSLAHNNHSIGYEVICSISNRVPRIYINL